MNYPTTQELPKCAGNYSEAGLWTKLAYETVKASITPDIERQASNKLGQWFGGSAYC